MPREDGYKNLIPCKKGDAPRNPNGRPKGSKNFRTYLKEMLEIEQEYQDPFTKEKRKITNYEMLLYRLYDKALRKGDLKAMEMIIDRIDGKPKSTTDINVDANPLVIREITSKMSQEEAEKIWLDALKNNKSNNNEEITND